tara:strand:+ start:2771 stop:3016 length:246 start_codon:yes stop_codon:yes gene_type:complete
MEFMTTGDGFVLWTTIINYFIQVVDKIAIGIWLFLNIDTSKPKKALWGLFGLLGGLIAALVFLVMLLVESVEFNKVRHDAS